MGFLLFKDLHKLNYYDYNYKGPSLDKAQFKKKNISKLTTYCFYKNHRVHNLKIIELLNICIYLYRNKEIQQENKVYRNVN